MALLREKIPNDRHISAAAMRFYYGRWLTYRNSSQAGETLLNDPLFLAKREVCLTCKRADNPDEEFFMRWQCFRDVDVLKERLISMDDMMVHKFDWGAVYNIPINQREVNPSAFKPLQKELVLDIDMNDYDDIRTCCKDKKVCSKCWQFLAVAVRLLDCALRDDFGFKHILWVFSGRRGIHGWVCDTDARLLTNESRAQLAEYLNICNGSDQQAKKVSLWGRVQHPSVDRAFSIAFPRFHRLLQEQDFLFTSTGVCSRLMEHLPSDEGLSGTENSSNSATKSRALIAEFSHVKSSVETFVQKIQSASPVGSSSSSRSVLLFEELCRLCNCNAPAAFAKAGSGLKEAEAYPAFIKEIVLAYSYPRLDINVSKDTGHLLKSPFCIHHGTGRVCVPVNLHELEAFDPERVPTLSRLRAEFDDKTRNHLPPQERTSLSPFVKHFKESFLSDLEKTCVEELKCK